MRSSLYLVPQGRKLEAKISLGIPVAEDHAPPGAIHLLAVKQHRTLTMLPAVA